MGYTHYWYRLASLPADKFAAAVADCRKICDALPIPLGDWEGEGEPEFSADCISFNGSIHSESFARDGGALIWPAEKAEGLAMLGATDAVAGKWLGGDVLNGRCVDENGDGSYESFVVGRELELHPDQAPDDDEGRYFNQCKTNFRPYDLSVQCCLIALKEHLGEMIRIQSDGTDEQWNEARDACQVILGYGLLFRLDHDATAET